MREVLDLFPPSQLLAHCLSETVNSVQKKRRESRNLAPLNNHRYLMQVMETNRPLFSGTGSAAVITQNANRQSAPITAMVILKTPFYILSGFIS